MREFSSSLGLAPLVAATLAVMSSPAPAAAQNVALDERVPLGSAPELLRRPYASTESGPGDGTEDQPPGKEGSER